MADLEDTSCCGIREIHDLEDSSPETLAQVGEQRYEGNNKCTFITFSDAIRYRHGEALCSYIRNNGLGKVITSEAKKNPKSGNMIRMYCWTVNDKAFKKWYDKYRSKHEDEDEDDIRPFGWGIAR